jgi:hypothetical protein
MNSDRAVIADGPHAAFLTERRRALRGGIAIVIAASLAAVVAQAGSPRASADDDARDRECSNRTLQGDYGLIGVGTRAIAGGATEAFATVSMVTYDGNGGFTAVGVSHGQSTGVRAGALVSGTYSINADCTGGQVTNIPGGPPLEDRFVIVDKGREVRTVVISPVATIATANLRKR